MRRIFFGLAALTLGLALTTSVAEAHGRSGGRGVGHGYRGHVVRYGGYRGHWGPRVWSPVYHRHQYWDASAGCYFYYDAGCGGYVRCP